jgi:HK97 family phage portal protein
MAGLKHLFQRIWLGSAEPRASLSMPDSWMFDSLGSQKGAAGISVTPEKAMTLGAVSACVRLIAESIASLPLHVYRQSGDRKRDRIVGTPEYRLLHDEPNPIMTSFVWRETLAAHVLLWGNAYALILRNGGGEPVALLPVHPRGVVVRKQASGELVYGFQIDSRSYVVNQWDMLHIPGLSFDGFTGMSPIRYAAESIGLALAAEQYGAAFFGNGSVPAGVISVQGRMSPKQVEDLRNSWTNNYGGLGNANKTAVLFDGGKFERISMPPEEAQFIETRKYQVSDIARWYRVPPYMIGDLERATFSNIEHQGLDFVTHTLRPWLVRFEQEFNRKLFPTSASGAPSDIYVEFNVDGLLRGDIKARGDYYVRGRQWGWLSANDIRAKENMDAIEGGDVYLTPLNMVDANNPAKDDPEGTSNV